MSENPYHDESNIADEFKNLGKNIGDLLKTAWDNPERKRVQQEIENGFNDLANHPLDGFLLIIDRQHNGYFWAGGRG